MQGNPRVSIIIVNFNGRHLLDDCLTSLENLDFPENEFEVILVDNNSSDDTIPYLSKYFPWVHVIQSNENLGFTGGNELGLQHAKGEYIVLLNSDVEVDRDWLKSLLEAAKPKNVGIVSSKLRFAIPFVEVSLKSRVIPKSQINHGIDHSPVGILVEEVICEDSTLNSLVYYKDGFYDKNEGEVCMRRTKGPAHILLPFPKNNSRHSFTFTIHGYESSDKKPIDVELSVGSEKMKFQILPFEVKQFDFVLEKKNIQKELKWLIQNAGNIVLSNGYSKDRGSLIDLHDNEVREFYEEESAYFEKPAKLLAACGASCLIKRDVIKDIGFLDGHYFMYYEDVEYSVRAWKAGWDVVYEPTAVGYHKHRSTTGNTESIFLVEHLERNHLAFVITHFPLTTVFNQLLLFVLRLGMAYMKSFVFQFRDNVNRTATWHRKYQGRKAAFKFILFSLPRLFTSRQGLKKLFKENRKAFDAYLY